MPEIREHAHDRVAIQLQETGHVETRGDSHTVSPSFGATILEWLVEDGDPVSAGQPLVRLQPEGNE